jgi:CRISPR-associated protein Csm3
MALRDGIKLYGRIFLVCELHACTGLHIGGAAGGLEIGGVDNPVIRDPITGRPYVPGSSLKGKMRSLAERSLGLLQNRRIGSNVRIHLCEAEQEYASCPVCNVFGTTGEKEFVLPTRLLVRDAFLTEEAARRLEQVRTDLPYTEVKWEAAIDRVTSAATPRQVERVPAGAVFAPVEMVYNLYAPGDDERLALVLESLALLEDDYLGGLGSRGSGQVKFLHWHVVARSCEDYEKEVSLAEAQTLQKLLGLRETIISGARKIFQGG